MSPWELPTSLEIGGVGYTIRTDFRDVLHVLTIFSDPEYENDEKTEICLRVIYEDFDAIPMDRYQEAVEKALAFIDMDVPMDSGKKSPRLVDWEHDGPVIIPAVNKVLGKEVRELPHLHWWTFLGAYMELGECLFSTVLGVRQKRAKGKKLEKYEEEFCRANKALVDMKKREDPEQAAVRAELKKLFV